MKYSYIALYVAATVSAPLLYGMEGAVNTNKPCFVIEDAPLYIEGVSGIYELPSLKQPMHPHVMTRKTIMVEGTLPVDFIGTPAEQTQQCIVHIMAQLYRELGSACLQPQKCNHITVYVNCSFDVGRNEILPTINKILLDIFPTLNSPFCIFLSSKEGIPFSLQAEFVY